MPPCAAIECARRGESWNVTTFTLVAELGEARGRRRAGQAGADDDDLEAALVRRVDELDVELVVVPLLFERAGGDLASRASSSPQRVVPERVGTRQWAVWCAGTAASTSVQLHRDREAEVADEDDAGEALREAPAQRVVARVVDAQALEHRPGAVVQVERERDVRDRCTRSRRRAGCRLYTRLLYGSPRTNCGLALPHVRSIRWKIEEQQHDDAGPAHRARREVGGDVVALRLVLRPAGRALRLMSVSPYAEWMWKTNARISTIRIVHSSTVRGSRWPGHVAQRLAVEVDLLLREVELQVADQVGDDEAHQDDAGDGHHPLLADRAAVEAHDRRPGRVASGGSARRRACAPAGSNRRRSAGWSSSPSSVPALLHRTRELVNPTLRCVPEGSTNRE